MPVAVEVESAVAADDDGVPLETEGGDGQVEVVRKVVGGRAGAAATEQADGQRRRPALVHLVVLDLE